MEYLRLYSHHHDEYWNGFTSIGDQISTEESHARANELNDFLREAGIEFAFATATSSNTFNSIFIPNPDFHKSQELAQLLRKNKISHFLRIRPQDEELLRKAIE